MFFVCTGGDEPFDRRTQYRKELSKKRKKEMEAAANGNQGSSRNLQIASMLGSDDSDNRYMEHRETLVLIR